MGQQFGWSTLEEIKQAVALDRVKSLEGNITKAAESLHITRPTLHKLLADFEKKSAEDKQRVEANRAKLVSMNGQDKDAFKFDENSGLSVPQPPPPIPKVKLFTRPEAQDIVTENTIKENDKIKKATALIRDPKPPTLLSAHSNKPAKVKSVHTEGEEERARFAKLKFPPLKNSLVPRGKKKKKKATAGKK